MTNSKDFLLANIDSSPSFSLTGKAYQLGYFNDDDLDAVLALENSAGPHPWSRKNFLSSIESSHQCIALRCDNEVIAQTVLSFSAGEAEILIFSVDRKYQGKGIGSHFLRSLLTLCELKAEQVFLEVRESNEAAIALYDSVGFNQIGERPNYYPRITHSTFEIQGSGRQNSTKSNRENALIYAKHL